MEKAVKDLAATRRPQHLTLNLLGPVLVDVWLCCVNKQCDKQCDRQCDRQCEASSRDTVKKKALVVDGIVMEHTPSTTSGPAPPSSGGFFRWNIHRQGGWYTTPTAGTDVFLLLVPVSVVTLRVLESWTRFHSPCLSCRLSMSFRLQLTSPKIIHISLPVSLPYDPLLDTKGDIRKIRWNETTTPLRTTPHITT